MDKVIALGREFGMSPMSRMSLKLPPEEKEATDPLAEMMARRNKAS